MRSRNNYRPAVSRITYQFVKLLGIALSIAVPVVLILTGSWATFSGWLGEAIGSIFEREQTGIDWNRTDVEY